MMMNRSGLEIYYLFHDVSFRRYDRYVGMKQLGF